MEQYDLFEDEVSYPYKDYGNPISPAPTMECDTAVAYYFYFVHMPKTYIHKIDKSLPLDVVFIQCKDRIAKKSDWVAVWIIVTWILCSIAWVVK